MAESLCCSTETITTLLLIGYIPLHFGMFKIKKKKKEGLPDNRMKFLMDMVIGTFRYPSGDSICKYGS